MTECRRGDIVLSYFKVCRAFAHLSSTANFCQVLSTLIYTKHVANPIVHGAKLRPKFECCPQREQKSAVSRQGAFEFEGQHALTMCSAFERCLGIGMFYPTHQEHKIRRGLNFCPYEPYSTDPPNSRVRVRV